MASRHTFPENEIMDRVMTTPLTQEIDRLREENARLREIAEASIWQPGEHEGFKHILYCRLCHYSISQGHGVNCLLYVKAALSKGK